MDDLVKQALADRIKEHDAAFTNLHREYDRRGDRIEELEAKLAKAMAAIEQMQTASDAMMLHIARATLAELKGQGDE